MEVKNISTFKLLFLFHLLLDDAKTKNEIVENFENINLKINKTTINRYLSILAKNGVAIEQQKIKNQNLYSIPKQKAKLNFTKKELLAIKSYKNQLYSYKNYDLIRRTMRLFYKIAMNIDDMAIRKQFINFGYFSKINWALVLKLEELCKTKSVIEVEYLSSNAKKDMILHIDSITMNDYSNRLYLNCTIHPTNKLSRLPIDKIFSIKKVINELKPFNLYLKAVDYTVSTSIYNSSKKNLKEKVIKSDEKYTTLEAIVDDEFTIIQRLLRFCPELYYISDDKIKSKVIEKLNLIKANYGTK